MPEPLQEILAVSLDASEFQRGLEELRRLWNSFTQEVEAQNVAGPSAGALTGLLSGFSELKSALTEIAAEYSQVIESFAHSAEEAAARMEQAAVDSAERAARTTGGSGNGGKKLSEDIDIEQQGLTDEYAAKQKQLAEEIELEQQGLADRYAELEQKKYEAAFASLEKQDEAQRKFAEDIAVEQEGILNRYEEIEQRKVALAEAAAEKIAAAQRKLAENIAIEQEGIANKAAEAEEKKALAAEKATEQIAASQRKLAEEIAIEQQGLVDQYIALQEKKAAAAEAAARREEEAQEQSARRAQESAEKKAAQSGFGAGFLPGAGILADVGRVVRFAIEWQAVGAAINGVMAVIAEPFHAVQEGMQYLRDTEKAADDLSGVLLANVQYSKNLADNFKEANSAAVEVVKALQDTAAKDNLDPAQLNAQFKNVVEAGGARGVQTTGDLIKLTEDFSLAFKALGVNAQGARREIYNALQGTPQASSRFLEIVGMTAQEWKNVRDQAYEAGNIVDVLAPKLQPYIDATREASGHQEDLLKNIDLMKERLEAVFAKPLYDQFNTFLTRFTSWIEENKEPLKDLAMTLGTVASAIVEMSAAFASLALPPGFEQYDRHSKQKSVADLSEDRGHGDITGMDSVLLDPALRQKVLEKSGNPLDKPITSIRTPPQITPDKAPPSEIPDDMTRFETELKRVKEATNERLFTEKAAVAEKTKSQEESTKSVLGYLKEEDDLVQALVAHYKELIQNSKDKGTPAGQQRIKTATDRLTGIGEASTESTNQAGDNSVLETIRARQEAQAAANKEALAGVNKNLREELAASEASHKEKNTSEEQLLQEQIDSQTKAHKARQQILNSEYDQAGQNVQSRNAAFEALTQEEDAYTAEVRRLSGLRVDAIGNETKKRQEAAAEQRVIAAQSEEERDQISVGLSGRTNFNRFTTNASNLDTQRADAQSRLTKAQAEPGAADEVRKLQQEIARIDLEKLRNVAAYLAAIRGDNQLSQRSKKALEIEATKDVSGSDSKKDKDTANTDRGFDAIFGPNFKEKWDKAGDSLSGAALAADKTSLALSALGNSVNLVTGILGAMAQGRKQGGTAGGIGAGLSAASGAIGDVGDALGVPGLGQVASGVGAIMSMIGGAMMAETIRIANGIKDAIKQTTTAYQEQSVNLSSTIVQLQAERANAVAELSGKKGGWDQLKDILSSLDPEIASLQIQQRDLVRAFADSFNSAQLQIERNSDALSTINDQWVQINKQVIDYINAGGDAATAAQFLSDQLQLIQKSSQEQLNEGEQQAVEDAINLNNLLLQRTQLVQSLNEQAFALQNQDATERTQAGAVTRAQQLRDLQINSQQQLNDLNYQIQTTQEKVSAESQVFQIATSIADLHRQDDALTIAALDLQLSKYTALQELVASITQGANGLFSSTEGFLQPTNNPIGQTITLNGGINVTVVSDSADPAAIGTAVGDSVAAELAAMARNGPYAV